MNDNSSGLDAFIFGFVIGGIVGAVVALLYAPKTGEETRQYIRDKGIELKDKAVETTSDLKQKSTEALNDISSKADEFAKKVKENETTEKSADQEAAEPGSEEPEVA